MSLIGYVTNVPLFTTIPEALAWARRNTSENDYHVHVFEGKKGYMGGTNHQQATLEPQTPVPPTPVPPTTPSSIRLLGSSGNSGGGGGRGGY